MGLDDFFMQIAAKSRNRVPYDRRADELSRLPYHGIPESEMQPDPGNPIYQGWLRGGSTVYGAAPQYPNPVFPWTQISPKIDSHSNMPQVTPGDLSRQRALVAMQDGAGISYDELGRSYPGLTPDEALRNYVAPPGAYVSYNSPFPGRPPMAPQPGAQAGLPPDSGFLDFLNAMRGGG